MTLCADFSIRYEEFTLQSRLRLKDGVLGLLGASGSGKSLTLQAIAGVVLPHTGQIRFRERVLFDSERKINLPPQQRNIGMFFQQYALFPTMTVQENIAAGLSREKDRQKKARAVRDRILRMGLAGLEHHRPHQLSGGQQQRVALARMLAADPSLLLLDEPFSALDTRLKEEMREELRNTLQEEAKPAILVTHDRNEAYALCDTLAVMEDGRIRESGSVKTLFEDPHTRAGAELTGCENILPARKEGPRSVFVPAWNRTLDAGRAVKDDLVAIGIRAGHIAPMESANRMRVRIGGVSEQPDRRVVEVCPEGADPAAPTLRLHTEKDTPLSFESAGIRPGRIHLLYDDVFCSE